jgi:acylphosphatase
MSGQSSDLARAHAIVTGRVQGVCYRSETHYKAQSLGVKGWVKNLRDGTVELVVEGDRGSVEKLITWCRRGPEFARVEGVQVTWEEPTGTFKDFDITW